MEDHYAPPPIHSDKTKHADKDDSGWRQLAERFKLSARQLKVLQMLFEGKSQKVIARSLGCKRNTVNSHVHRIYNKLGVKAGVELGARLADFFSAL